MSKKVVVIDYKIGNVFSVCNALSKIGAVPLLSDKPEVIANAERVILPGVGAFPKGMENLSMHDLNSPIEAFTKTGRPFLGICLGMQLLMERSTEFGEHVGLGLIKGTVEPLPNRSVTGENIKIPVIGWKNIKIEKNKTNYDLTNLGYYYFVHSFFCKPTIEDNKIAVGDYQGHAITAIVGHDNILGVQFHPERSGADGLLFLQKFVFSKM